MVYLLPALQDRCDRKDMRRSRRAAEKDPRCGSIAYEPRWATHTQHRVAKPEPQGPADLAAVEVDQGGDHCCPLVLAGDRAITRQMVR